MAGAAAAAPRALRVPGLAGLLRHLGGPHAILIHASETWFASAARGDFDFVEGLAETARARGTEAFLIRAERPLARILMRRHINLLLGTPPRRRGPWAAWQFHIRPAYVPGFWYMDPEGVHRNASFARDPFDAVGAAMTAADNALVARARAAIPAPGGPPLPPARAAVFLQDIDDHRRDRAWIGTATMIRVTAAACDGTVLLRFHPRQSRARRDAVTSLAATLPNVLISDADPAVMIDAADVTVTQNSSTGFQALLRGRPVITCAPSDYRHATVTARTADELTAALKGGAAARLRDFPLDAYLHRHLGRHWLEPAAPDFAQRVMDRLRPAFLALHQRRRSA